jgi:pimeloyl-ACP methyl ester carboxylesterase
MMRTVTVDLPGFGHSSRPTGGVSLESCAEALDLVVDRLGLASPVVVGHSMGAAAAGRWVAHHGGQAVSLVLVGAAADPATSALNPKRWRNANLSAAATLIMQAAISLVPVYAPLARAAIRRRWIRRLLLTPFVALPDAFDPTTFAVIASEPRPPISTLEALRIAARTPMPAALAGLDVPVDLVVGAKDRLTSTDATWRLADAIGARAVHVLAGRGHWPQLENAAELAALVTAIFTRPQPASEQRVRGPGGPRYS